MGTSGFILKKRENVDIYQLIREVKAAANRAGLLSPIDLGFKDARRGGVYVTGSIANTFEEIPGAEAMPIYIFSDGYDEYNWILEGGRLINVVIFDFIRDCERVLLDFLYEYLKSNPEDYFWCGGYSWYFTFDDIAHIKQREFDPDWCYKDPHLNDTENIIELSNIEIHEYCLLNIRTGEKEYNTGKKKIPYFTGQYFRDNDTFFALFPSQEGPIMYYQGKQFSLTPMLHIYLETEGERREFTIDEYGIRIWYRTSKYIGFDAWSAEKDVDLFYQIYTSYKEEDYYKKFTITEDSCCLGNSLSVERGGAVMGTSGFILKKRENIDIYQLVHEVRTVVERAGLLSRINSKIQEWFGEVYVEGYIANTFEKIPETEDVKKEAMLVDIYAADDEQYDDEYDWLLEGGHLNDAVVFERVNGCERILLDFLYEYLKSNPEDYFWCGGYSWYFTFDDIARIKQREFDPLWCYKDPRLNGEKE